MILLHVSLLNATNNPNFLQQYKIYINDAVVNIIFMQKTMIFFKTNGVFKTFK